MTNQIHIIVIDDEDAVRDAIEFSLMLSNFQVTTFKDPHLAATYLRRNIVDLIITDLIMPEMSGVDFIREVRQFDQQTPILAITGGARIGQNNMAQAALETGAQAICKKPMGKQELIDQIRQLL